MSIFFLFLRTLKRITIFLDKVTMTQSLRASSETPKKFLCSIKGHSGYGAKILAIETNMQNNSKNNPPTIKKLKLKDKTNIAEHNTCST